MKCQSTDRAQQLLPEQHRKDGEARRRAREPGCELPPERPDPRWRPVGHGAQPDQTLRPDAQGLFPRGLLLRELDETEHPAQEQAARVRPGPAHPRRLGRHGGTGDG